MSSKMITDFEDLMRRWRADEITAAELTELMEKHNIFPVPSYGEQEGKTDAR